MYWRFDFKTRSPPTLPIATHLFTTTQAHPVGLGRYRLSEAFAHGFDGQPPQVVALIEPACEQERVAYCLVLSRLVGATGMGNWANPRSVELRNRNVRGEWRRFLMQPFHHRKD